MNHIIWDQLLSISHRLNDSTLSKTENINVLLAQLASINITHERSFEPAEHFEEYVVLSLCQAIHDTLKSEL